MAQHAEIRLKSGSALAVENLQFINKHTSGNSTPVKVEDFNAFFLFDSQRLVFVGEKDSISLVSNEIEYVKFIHV